MQLNQDDAEAIAKKLKASFAPGRKHELAQIYYAGKLIASFGIRRASKDIGHDYIPNQIHVSMHQAKSLAKCTMSYDDWVARLKEKALIDN